MDKEIKKKTGGKGKKKNLKENKLNPATLFENKKINYQFRRTSNLTFQSGISKNVKSRGKLTLLTITRIKLKIEELKNSTALLQRW